MIKSMIETLILTNLIRTRWQVSRQREELRGDNDPEGWLILLMLFIGPLLWPIGLLMTARHYYKLSWRRSITATVVATSLILIWVPAVYLLISAVIFVVAVWYFGNDEG